MIEVAVVVTAVRSEKVTALTVTAILKDLDQTNALHVEINLAEEVGEELG